MVAVLAITLVALLGCSLVSAGYRECIARGENIIIILHIV